MDAENVKQTSSQRNANEIVDESPEEVLPYHVYGLATQLDGFGKSIQVVAHEGDLCHIHSNVSATPYCDAHIGKSQGLGVIDAIAHHRHLLASILKVLYQGLFVAW